MGLVSPFVTSLVAHAARSASTRLALTREKGGPATARKKPMPCPRDHVFLMIPAPSLLGHHTRVPVLVARTMSPSRPHQPPQPHHVTQHPNAKLHIQEQDSGASVEIKVSLAGTALVQMYLVVSFFVEERVVHAARSVWTRSAQQRETVGAATTRSQRMPYPRVLVSLTVHAHLLLARPMKILPVLAANH